MPLALIFAYIYIFRSYTFQPVSIGFDLFCTGILPINRSPACQCAVRRDVMERWKKPQPLMIMDLHIKQRFGKELVEVCESYWHVINPAAHLSLPGSWMGPLHRSSRYLKFKRGIEEKVSANGCEMLKDHVCNHNKATERYVQNREVILSGEQGEGESF